MKKKEKNGRGDGEICGSVDLDCEVSQSRFRKEKRKTKPNLFPPFRVFVSIITRKSSVDGTLRSCFYESPRLLRKEKAGGILQSEAEKTSPRANWNASGSRRICKTDCSDSRAASGIFFELSSLIQAY